MLDLSGAEGSEDETLGWQRRLANIVHFYKEAEVRAFIDDVASPALDAVAAEMSAAGFAPDISRGPDHVTLAVNHGDRGAFRYSVKLRGFRTPSFAWAETRKAQQGDKLHYRAMAQSPQGDQPRDVTGYTREQLIHEIVGRYASFRHIRRMA